MEDFKLPEKKITRKEYNEFLAFKEEYQENEVRRNLLLQEQNDILAGGLRSANLKEYRNTMVFNESDSLDADNPFLMDIEVISEMTKIVSVKLSFKIKNFRAYSKSAVEKEAVSSGASSISSSAGGGVVSSASGGGQTPTTSSGGSSTPTSAGGGVVTTASGGGSTSGSGGEQTSSQSSGGVGSRMYCEITGGLVAHEGGYHYSSIPDTNLVSRVSHTHTVANHTHSTPNHTHTGGSHTHTVTIAAHTHTVTIAAHTHTGGSHTHNIEHTHNIPAHSHDITYGIHEEETSPTIQVFISRDNGETYSLPLGSYTKDQGNLDITRFIDTVGEKVIKFTSDVRCRISARVLLKLDIKAR